MAQNGPAKPRPPVRLRWVSTLASALILGAFLLFYFVHEKRTSQLTVERDLRLLAVASDALRQSIGGTKTNRSATLGVQDCNGIQVEIEAAESQARNRFCIHFDEILRFVPRARQAFDRTFLVEEKNGAALRQAGRPEVPEITSLGSLKLFEDGKPAKTALEFSKAGPMTNVHFGDGKAYRLLCQATAGVTRLKEPEGVQLHLCGLVSEDRLHTRWLLPQSLLILSCVTLALTLLLPPFLRMRLLSPTQRFRFTDAFALAVCLLFAFILVTLTTRGVVTQLRLEGFVDGQLQDLAQEMSQHLKKELDAARSQLGTIELSKQPSGIRRLEAEDVREYPQLESMSWANEQGALKWLATSLPLDQQTLLSVAGRAYFHRALARDEAVIDSVRSYTSGQTRLVVTRRTKAPEPEGVLILSLQLASLTRPVLPEGVGFALVDRTGNVLFHSDPSLSNSHNVLTECSGNRDLRAKLEHGHQAPDHGPIEDLSYFGVAHRAYVSPVPLGSAASKLSLIVFEESSGLRGVVFDTMKAAVVASIVYASFWLAAGIVWVLAVGKRRITWLWPEERLLPTYLGLSLWFVLLVCVAATAFPHMLALRASGHAQGTTSWLSLLPAFAFSMPFLVVSSALLVFWMGRFLAARWSKATGLHLPFRAGGYWRAYCLAATLFWLLCAVIPPYVFSSVTMDQAAQSFAERRTASFDARAETSAVSSNPPLVTKPRYEPPAVRAYEKTLYLGQEPIGTFARHLLQTLHAQDVPPVDKAGEARLRLARFVSFAFTLAIVPLAFLVMRWLAGSILLRGIEAKGEPTPQQPGSVDSWCVVASRRTCDVLSQQQGGVDRAIVGTWLRGGPGDELLERLEERPKRHAPSLIVATRTPIEALRSMEAKRRRDREKAKDKETAPPSTLVRWTAVLRDFRIEFVRDPQPTAEERDDLLRELLDLEEAQTIPRAAQWLARELGSSSYVMEACRTNLPRGSLSHVERSEGLRRVRDAAWYYYLEIWNACSRLEQLTLVQLAEEGFVNEKRREVVRTLLSRGILSRRPMLAPLNDSFTSFVRTQGGELGVRAWEAPPQGLSWDHLRAPLFVLFACLAYVLFFTQRALFDSTLLFATTLTAIVPHLGRLAAATVPSLQRYASLPSAESPTADTEAA